MIQQIFILALLTLNTIWCIPASPTPIIFTQPDGTTFSGYVRGDEWCNWYEKKDGYTITQNTELQWVYVTDTDKDGQYILSEIPAHFSHDDIIITKKHISPPRSIINPEHERYAIQPSQNHRDRFQIPLILIEYPNMNAQYSVADFDSLMNQIGYVGPHGPTGSFREYYLENSYDAFDPETTVSGWYMADSNYQVYGYANGYGMVRELIANAVDDAEEAGMDWSVFDNDGDGYVDALNVVHAGPGAEEGNGSYIWSHKWSLGDWARYYDGVWINSYTINPEKQGGVSPTMVNIGVICHEFGHALGLPDLYDIDYSSSGIGTWGLMSGGSWGGNGNSAWYPAHMCAWSKMNVSVGAWLTPITTTNPIEMITLPSVEMNPVVYKMDGNGDELEYFLFENRQKVGFDQTLRNSGLLIWHIDDNVSCAGNGCNSDDWHRRVDLEQADGLYHLNYGTNSGDAADTYPGTLNKTEFSFITNPNSQYYSGDASGIHVHDIQESDELVSLTFRNIPTLAIDQLNYTEIMGDGDLIPNPGETVNLIVSLFNPSNDYITDLSAVVTDFDSTYIDMITDSISLADVGPFGLTNNIDSELVLSFSDDAPLGNYTIELYFTGILDEIEFEQALLIDVEITIAQEGFPYLTNSQIKSAPAVVDINDDGNMEIIFNSWDGYVHVINQDGSSFSGNWPFDTGNQVWASPTVADLNGDNILEIIIVSKSHHMYILTPSGDVITDINLGQFLIGTPAIGNLDDDTDLEIVFGSISTSSNSSLFAINLDQSYVEGFPLILGEKVYSGVALADFNGNGKDDIVVTTNENHIHLFYDDGTLADGFPFNGEGGFRTAPAVMDVDGDKFIFAGSRDHKFYALDSGGYLSFVVETGDEIISSPAFIQLPASVGIFFTSKDGFIYGINQLGEPLPGWPIELDGLISYSPVVADLNNDGSQEILVVTNTGTLFAFDLNGSIIYPFPVYTNESGTGIPVVADIDLDNDLEVLYGTSTKLLGFDVKTAGSTDNLWSDYRGNLKRNGLFIANSVQMATDHRNIIPTKYNLKPAYPNPFNPMTTISYAVPLDMAGELSLQVFDLKGRLIETLVQGNVQPGSHTIHWNAAQFPSGMYFVQLKAEKFSKTQKLILLK